MTNDDKIKLEVKVSSVFTNQRVEKFFTDINQLLIAVKSHSQFSHWKPCGTDSSGSPLYREPAKNPYRQLSKFGIYNFKDSALEISLVGLAKELEILQTVKEITESQKLDKFPDYTQKELDNALQTASQVSLKDDALKYLFQKYEKAEKSDSAIIAFREHLETRAILIDDALYEEIFNVLGVRVSLERFVDSNGTFVSLSKLVEMKQNGEKVFKARELLFPVFNIDKNLVQLHRIIINEEGKKIAKKKSGVLFEKEKGAALIFGNLSSSDSIIFEGLEDAICYYCFIDNTKRMIVSLGTGSILNIIPFLNKNGTSTFILDNDVPSFEASKKLIINYPSVILKKSDSPLDLNDSLINKSLDTWKNSLKDISVVNVSNDQDSLPIHISDFNKEGDFRLVKKDTNDVLVSNKKNKEIAIQGLADAKKESLDKTLKKNPLAVYNNLIKPILKNIIFVETANSRSYESYVYENDKGTWKRQDKIQIERFIQDLIANNTDLDTAPYAIDLILKQAQQDFYYDKFLETDFLNNLNKWQRSEEGQKMKEKYGDDVVALQNGLFSLQAQQLIPFTPLFFNISKLPYSYDPKAECPKFLEYLFDLFITKDINGEIISPESNAEVSERYYVKIKFVKQWLAYLLSNSFHDQCFLFIKGGQNAGKGTFASLCRKFLGDSFCVNKGLNDLDPQNQFGGSDVPNKKLLIFDESLKEVANKAIINTIKEWSGGGNLTIRELYQPKKSIKMTAKMMFLSNNNVKAFYDPQGAFKRRILYLNLPNRVEISQMIPDLVKNFIPELPGIFNFACEGYKEIFPEKDVKKFLIRPHTEAELLGLDAENSFLAAFYQEYLSYLPCLETINARKKGTNLRTIYEKYVDVTTKGGGKPQSFITFKTDLQTTLKTYLVNPQKGIYAQALEYVRRKIPNVPEELIIPGLELRDLTIVYDSEEDLPF